MKIFAIMIVKNESDIIQSALASARVWADKIYVMDNGSSDGTWEIIQSMADETIVPVKQDFRPFRDDMRAEIFERYRAEATDEDWWAFSLDADEFYVDDPRKFLKSIPQKYHVVAKKSLDYVITKEDVNEYAFTGDFEIDKEHIKYLKKRCWCEYRFFRHRDSIRWKQGRNLHQPSPVGVLAPNRILVKHYQFRSPIQIQKRLDTRNAIQKGNTNIFQHITQTDWLETLETRNNCILDSGGGYHNEAIFQSYNRSGLNQAVWKILLIRFGIFLRIW